jgi:hypothetical protein
VFLESARFTDYYVVGLGVAARQKICSRGFWSRGPISNSMQVLGNSSYSGMVVKIGKNRDRDRDQDLDPLGKVTPS